MTTLNELRQERETPTARVRSLAVLAASGGAVLTAALVGAVAARSGDADYYEQLDRPSWSPPAWLFSPVWIALYAVMAIALWLVARQGLGRRDVRIAVGLFVIQLVLNAAWTPIFFAAERPALAALDIVALLTVLVSTTIAFWRIRPLAGALLVPYVAWVAFATALNIAIAVRA
jgi:tryptophan-rich sensory protein